MGKVLDGLGKTIDNRMNEMIDCIVFDVMNVKHDAGGPIGHWCCEEDVREAVKRNMKETTGFWDESS